MYETHVTVMGNVATKVDHWTSSSGVPVARFRLASTVRRFDKRTEQWTDASTSFYTVWAWRSLATNVASSVSRGEPVVVRGQLRLAEEEREGRRYLNADLTAATVGHDLSRGTAAFVRVSRAAPELSRGPAPAWPPLDAAVPDPFGTSAPLRAGGGERVDWGTGGGKAEKTLEKTAGESVAAEPVVEKSVVGEPVGRLVRNARPGRSASKGRARADGTGNSGADPAEGRGSRGEALMSEAAAEGSVPGQRGAP
ncbi:single-stranded DNA-binding protein [Streptomyces tubbatahanensis]|uniref:Single-stranded DNA-binding protein n=1 Tax=Streptomyces tubbatahanensis TaxID=2923272 RepID=A0ABY3XRG5_9ACTN|nr:single-stranded DNA-binding protein [Streptomyces tubbatahanensis]UNS97057.1 single-stranded DNA-binding protein [Streptomyces tubbatahanensis]